LRLSSLDPKKCLGRGGTTYESVRTRTREKEVELDGHGEVTRGLEFNLHQLASVDIQRLSPNSYSNRVGHRGLKTCG
jgi:hypothetical protein